jgi:hypothetical protein
MALAQARRRATCRTGWYGICLTRVRRAGMMRGRNLFGFRYNQTPCQRVAQALTWERWIERGNRRTGGDIPDHTPRRPVHTRHHQSRRACLTT